MKRPKRSRLLMVISLSSALGMLLHSMLTLADQHLRERYRLRQQDFELALRIISEPTKFDDPARAWASGLRSAPIHGCRYVGASNDVPMPKALLRLIRRQD